MISHAVWSIGLDDDARMTTAPDTWATRARQSGRRGTRIHRAGRLGCAPRQPTERIRIMNASARRPCWKPPPATNRGLPPRDWETRPCSTCHPGAGTTATATSGECHELRRLRQRVLIERGGALLPALARREQLSSSRQRREARLRVDRAGGGELDVRRELDVNPGRRMVAVDRCPRGSGSSSVVLG